MDLFFDDRPATDEAARAKALAAGAAADGRGHGSSKPGTRRFRATITSRYSATVPAPRIAGLLGVVSRGGPRTGPPRRDGGAGSKCRSVREALKRLEQLFESAKHCRRGPTGGFELTGARRRLPCVGVWSTGLKCSKRASERWRSARGTRRSRCSKTTFRGSRWFRACSRSSRWRRWRAS